MPILRLMFALPLAVAMAALPCAAQDTPRRDSLPVRMEGLAAILLGEVALQTERFGHDAASARVTRAARELAGGYRTVARSPDLTLELLARAATNRYRGAGVSPRTGDEAFQLQLLSIAQQARLVEQNDRLIELMAALVARR